MVSDSTSAFVTRNERFEIVARLLSELSDHQLLDLVEQAPVLGAGIGGTRSLLHVDKIPVFVKRVPLSELERLPENLMSTANLFNLPMGCHYGVGNPSFGAWRELAANKMTTGWVREGRSACFPLMYHSRVLDTPAFAGALPDEVGDIEAIVGHWNGSSAVRRRAEAIAESSASVTLFLEYLPQVLPDWLERNVCDDSLVANEALAAVEHSLRSGVAFMNAAGLFHFDAHFRNILADDQGFYFADFGLATSPSFDLSAAESMFLAANKSHDACHTITRLVDWMVDTFTDVQDWQARNELIQRCANGDDVLAHLPTNIAAVIKRYAPIAVVVNGFYRQLHLHDRATPYPTAEAELACATAGLAL